MTRARRRLQEFNFVKDEKKLLQRVLRCKHIAECSLTAGQEFRHQSHCQLRFLPRRMCVCLCGCLASFNCELKELTKRFNLCILNDRASVAFSRTRQLSSRSNTKRGLNQENFLFLLVRTNCDFSQTASHFLLALGNLFASTATSSYAVYEASASFHLSRYFLSNCAVPSIVKVGGGRPR